MDEHLRAAAEAGRIAAVADVPWRIKREWLDSVTWFATLPDPSRKFRQRYATPAFLADGKGQHEHVVPRAWLRAALLEHPHQAEGILSLAVACNVTRTEHQRLSAIDGAFGWRRYIQANVEVMDTNDGSPAVLTELSELQIDALERLGLTP